MNKIICPRCGAENTPGMVFCTNCGQSLATTTAQPAAHQPSSAPPKVSPPGLSQMPTAVMPSAAASTGMNRSLLFGLLGCGGLLVVFLFGIIVIGIFISAGQTGQANVISTTYNANNKTNYANNNSLLSNSAINDSNTNAVEQLNSSTLDEVRSLKQVGAFRQTEVKDVPAGDFYPSAS